MNFNNNNNNKNKNNIIIIILFAGRAWIFQSTFTQTVAFVFKPFGVEKPELVEES